MARAARAADPARRFVGRGDALAALAAELQAAAAGSARIVWIEGDGGIGKSTLIRRFLEGTGDGSVVGWADGAEEERMLPFGLVEQLTLALGLDKTATGVLGSEGRQADVLAVGARLLGALGAVDGLGVVVIDDLHWADADSAGALLFALRRVRREPLLVVLATRPDPAAALGDGWGRLLRDGARVRRIGLGGLDAGDLVNLAEATVGVRLGSAAAERLRSHTNGHPMHARALLEELGPAALDAGRVVLPAPRSLATVLVARVAALPAPARDLVAACAVLGSSAPLPLAAVVGSVSDPIPALEAAMGAGLLERSFGAEVRFPHLLVRGAIYNDLSPTRRRDLHQAAATATEGLPAIEHRVAASGGADDPLAGELEVLALDELNEGRTALAEHHLRAASALWTDSAAGDRCLLLAVEAVLAAGDVARTRSLRSVVEECGDTPHRTYVLGAVEFASGRLREAEELCAVAVAGLTSAQQAPSGLAARAAAVLAVVRVLLGRWEEAMEPARTAVEHAVGRPRQIARYALAQCVSNAGRVDELRTLASQLSGSDDPESVALSGLLKFWSDDLADAVDDLTAAVNPDRGAPPPRLLVPALNALGEAEYLLGRWDDAVAHGELAVSLAEDVGVIFALQHAHAIASYVGAGRGEFAGAAAHVDAAAGLVELVPTWGGTALVAVSRAVLAQARGDTVGMRQAVAVLLDGPMRANLEGVAAWQWRVVVAEALLATGDLDEAQRAVDGLEAQIARRQFTSPRTDAARLRGGLAEASGDVEAARAAYTDGSAGGELPLPTARLEIALGRLLRQVGERRAAVDQLRRARNRLAALGAQPFIARCDEELTSCGVTVGRGDTDPLGLTPAELAVAHLVAEGLSNREVATRLYVSAKAVEYHLGHIFAKLGITSRRQLAGRLTDRA